MSDLRVGVGTSAAGDTTTAVAEAVEKARAGLGGAAPQLAVVAATVDHDAARVHAAFRAGLPEVPLHGATTSLGVLGAQGVVMGAGGGIGVMLFASAGDARFSVGSASLEDGARSAGRRAAEALAARGPQGEEPRLLLIAPTPGQEEELLAGIAEVFPGVPIHGGSAADHAIEGAWSIFTDDGVQREGVSLAAIYGDAVIGAAFGGPYEPTTKHAVVTAANGRSIESLDGRPAVHVLHEWIGDAIADQARDGGNLLVQTALRPLGIEKRSSDGASFHVLLHPAQAHAAGAVDVFALPPPGATLCLMSGSEASLVRITGDLVDRALAQGNMKSADVRGAFLIYCAGCAGAIGPRLDDALAALRARLAGTPVLGFCTFGEQGFIPAIGNLHANLSVGLVLFG
jgi:hypothetical protein